MEYFTLTDTEVSTIYGEQDDLDFPGLSVDFNGKEIKIKFLKEKEGRIIDYSKDNNPYSCDYERQSTLWLKDEQGNIYKGAVFEGGCSKDDMLINQSSLFELEEKKAVKAKKVVKVKK